MICTLKLHRLFCLAAASLVLSHVPAGAAPIQFSGNGHYYQFIGQPHLTWTQARDAAEALTYDSGSGILQGYLATLTTVDENSFVRTNFDQYAGPWIGGSDSAAEGQWRWVTGPESQANSGAGTLFTYVDWRAGEPGNNTLGDEDYLALNWQLSSPDGWNDVPLDGGVSATSGQAVPSGFIVEYGGIEAQPQVSVPDGSTQANAGISAKQILNDGYSQGDGVYWIDPNGGSTDDAFQVYADMTTDGGGWILAVNSLLGNESATNHIVSNTGSPSATAAHTRDLVELAIARDAEIRHQISVVDASLNYHAKYTGRYDEMLPLLAEWISMSGHQSPFLLSENFGQAFSGNAFIGSAWYVGGGASIGTVPMAIGDGGLSQGPYSSLSSSDIFRYAIYIRELETPTFTNVNAVPEPQGIALAVLSIMLLGVTQCCLHIRKAGRTFSDC